VEGPFHIAPFPLSFTHFLASLSPFNYTLKLTLYLLVASSAQPLKMNHLHDAEKSSNNSDKNEDQYVTTTTAAAPHHDGQQEYYDPSKESIFTRLGVNFESFKRAPGTTG